MVCKSFAALEPRPSPSFFRCILLSPNEPLPRFVWAEYSSASDYTTMKCKTFTGNHLLGHIDSEVAVSGCNVGDWPLKQPDSHRLGIYYQDAYLVDDSPITPSITKWVGREAGHYFRGTFLAHGWKPEEIEGDDVFEFGRPCDLDTADLCYLLDYFLVQGEQHRKAYGDFKEFK
ncbi:hypothetical protein G6011_03559 [Alternaria panax]|uniref:Uncharacterized protein n=1 Tax=Alternaria panax TaxID=48097 RepID=A0AAD4NTA5_9PLEO|nr:hypothetical protein G6011_03559 [Alternaria panax]